MFPTVADPILIRNGMAIVAKIAQRAKTEKIGSEICTAQKYTLKLIGLQSNSATRLNLNEQGGIRTPDLLIRSQKLYPLSYLP